MEIKNSLLVFNAFADETRLRIMNLLGEGELCVCDLMRVLNEPQSKISRHLAYLRRAGLVQGRKQGLWMHYRMCRQKIKTYAALLETLADGRHDFQEFKTDLKHLHGSKNKLIGCCS